jgi:serine/threonine protein kinase
MTVAEHLLVAADGTSDELGRGGRYRLVRRLATGGMAEIWLARQSGIAGFEKQVVVKRTLPQHAGDDAFITMFLDEARLIASLHHPNIVQVHDIGVEREHYFYVMEHLEGADLARVVRMLERQAERMPLEHAILIAMGAAAGLHAAHEARDVDGRPLDVVHRDVSPGNLVVTFDGSVKLIDFGVAKAARRRTVTRHGVVKGKIAFMSPEQLQCKPLDRRSDVFALGILLHELTCGGRLFDGASEFDIMKQIVERPVPRPGERVPGYPSALEAVVLRALARRPEDRFETALDLFVALEQVAGELGLSPSQWALGRWLRERADLLADDDDQTTPSVERLAPAMLPDGEESFDGMETVDLIETSAAAAATPDLAGSDGDEIVTVEEPGPTGDRTAAPEALEVGDTTAEVMMAPDHGDRSDGGRDGDEGLDDRRTATVEIAMELGGAAHIPVGPAPLARGELGPWIDDGDTARRAVELARVGEPLTAPASPRPRRAATARPEVRVEFRPPRPSLPQPPRPGPLGTGPLPRIVPRPGDPRPPKKS